jgi:hypothetical protein
VYKIFIVLTNLLLRRKKMKNLNVLFAALALVFSAQTAQAQVEAPVWNCSLTFDVAGGGLRLLVGQFKLEGPGEIVCADIAGNVENLPVYVTIGAAPVSFSFGIGYMQVAGLATGVGIAGQPTDLLGTYVVGSVRGALVVGAGADMALHASERSLTLNAAVQVVAGAGLNIGFDQLTIERR